jgi:two-component system, NarL family, sensor histidine kinase DesK
METERTALHGTHASAPSAAGIGRADGPEAVIAASRISARLWRLYAYFWLVCLLFPILALTQTRLALAQLLIALAGLVIFVTSYFWVMWPHLLGRALPARAQIRTALLLAMLTALVLVLSLLYGSAFLWLFVGVSAIAGVTLTARRAFEIVVMLTLLTVGMGVGISGGIAQTDWLQLIPLVLLVRGLGVDMIGLALLGDALRDLHAARRELARMAVIEERLRLARDLHDLLGHNLSLIALKSELARRIVAQEPGRAADEIQEVEHVARQTLREVREAVANYRQPTLSSELDGARQLLEAAGIAWTIEDMTAALPAATDAVLAWTVREGVTNVIRHSRARQCRIRVSCANGSARAEVANDTYPEQGRDGLRSRRGSGLAGLAERVQAHGGHLEAGRLLIDGKAGFRLSVELPIHSSAPAIAERQP